MLAIIIATAFAVGAIVVFTGNVVVALLALVSLLAIVVGRCRLHLSSPR